MCRRPRRAQAFLIEDGGRRLPVREGVRRLSSPDLSQNFRDQHKTLRDHGKRLSSHTWLGPKHLRAARPRCMANPLWIIDVIARHLRKRPLGRRATNVVLIAHERARGPVPPTTERQDADAARQCAVDHSTCGNSFAARRPGTRVQRDQGLAPDSSLPDSTSGSHTTRGVPHGNFTEPLTSAEKGQQGPHDARSACECDTTGDMSQSPRPDIPRGSKAQEQTQGSR